MNSKNNSIELNPCFILVDDNPGDLHIMSYVLENLFPTAKVLCFEEGEDFISFWESTTIDLKSIDGIFLDFNMPGISGKEILEYLNAHSYEQAPIYIFSGAIIESLRVEVKSLGALDFLEKPVELEEIMKLFENLFHPQLSLA